MVHGVYGVKGSYAPQMMSGASMRMAPAQKMANLFDKIDASNTGSISKSQFVQAFETMKTPAAFKAAGADAVFAALDPTNSGSVTKQNFVQGMTKLMTQLRATNQTSGV
jgi:Ca2+-binding EF-hand superfamily protein